MLTLRAWFLGGTIGYGAGRDGEVERSSPAQLLTGLPPVNATVEARSHAQGPSASLDPRTLTDLLDEARASECDGFVVVQGTDTIEETAYLADLVWADPRPLVFTGAMRPPGSLSPDGPRNLWSALTVAASGLFTQSGAVVVMNDEVHAARWVRKTHTTSTGSVASPGAGPIGFLAEGQVHRTASIRPHRVHAPRRPLEAVVPVFAPGLGEGPQLLDSIAAFVDGLVVMGMGGGHVPSPTVEPLSRIAERVPVVLASRAYGSSLSRTYRSAGSEGDLLGRGLLPAGMLGAWQSRILLQVGLACDYDREELAAVLADAGTP